MAESSPRYQFARILHKQVQSWLEQGSPVESKSIFDCQKGNLLVWPDGLISELISVTLEEGLENVRLLHREETGILYERTLKLPLVVTVLVEKEVL